MKKIVRIARVHPQITHLFVRARKFGVGERGPKTELGYRLFNDGRRPRNGAWDEDDRVNFNNVSLCIYMCNTFNLFPKKKLLEGVHRLKEIHFRCSPEPGVGRWPRQPPLPRLGGVLPRPGRGGKFARAQDLQPC